MPTQPIPRERVTELVAELVQLHTEAVKNFDDDEDRIAAAADKAIEFICDGGYDSIDSDYLGDETCDVLQSLLTVALLRWPGSIKDLHLINDDI